MTGSDVCQGQHGRSVRALGAKAKIANSESQAVLQGIVSPSVMAGHGAVGQFLVEDIEAKHQPGTTMDQNPLGRRRRTAYVLNEFRFNCAEKATLS
jgi:hypothetical protein